MLSSNNHFSLYTKLIKKNVLKVTGDSLLIHVFTCSLFVGVYSVISDMTGYPHSCNSIKFIHSVGQCVEMLSIRAICLIKEILL